eukprot:23689-Pelagococcus_subviridis.AAC.3
MVGMGMGTPVDGHAINQPAGLPPPPADRSVRSDRPRDPERVVLAARHVDAVLVHFRPHRRRPHVLPPAPRVHPQIQHAVLLLEQQRAASVREVGDVDPSVAAARVRAVPAVVRRSRRPRRARVHARETLHAPPLPEIPQAQRAVAARGETHATARVDRDRPHVVRVALWS